MSIEDRKLTAEIIAYLNEKALDAVRGSEYGPDEHFFELAAEIIQDHESLVNDIKALIEKYQTLIDNPAYNPDHALALVNVNENLRSLTDDLKAEDVK